MGQKAYDSMQRRNALFIGWVTWSTIQVLLGTSKRKRLSPPSFLLDLWHSRICGKMVYTQGEG